MKKNTLILTSLLLFSGSQAALAADNSGFYLGAEGGLANTKYSDTVGISIPWIPSATQKITANDSKAFMRALAGYQFNNYIAVEAGAAMIPSVKFSLTSNIFGTKCDNSNEYIYDLNLKGIVPINEQFSVYGKAGVASLNLKSMKPDINLFQGVSTTIESNHALTATFGAGLNYAFTQHFSANLFYTGYVAKSSFGAINVGGVGLSYKF